MNFEYDKTTKKLLKKVQTFMGRYIYPNVDIYENQIKGFGENRWQIPPILETLKAQAKKEGLWNFFLPAAPEFGGLTNLQYAPIAELLGRVSFASEVFNCSAPDTGNMEVLHHFGSKSVKKKYLKALLEGRIRSAFAMTEKEVASSDASNIESEIRSVSDGYLLNGHKWWTSGACDPRCKVFIFMGKTDPKASMYQQQSMVVVDAQSPGIKIVRHLPVFGYDDAPHGHAEVLFENVKIPKENMLLGEGRGFEIAQARLGPGRIHHCMRTIGASELVLEKLCRRLMDRHTFGKPIYKHSVWEERVANARIDIERTRLLILKTADMMDRLGNKAARAEIAMIKVAAPVMACQIIDESIQAFGGSGVTEDSGLARAYAQLRTLRLADGPDEVHRRTISRLEL